jgi:hypothetical protein
MTISNGVIAWSTTCAQGSTVNPITVWATDSGTPSLSNSMTFDVTVGACVQLALGTTNVQAGQSSSIPFTLSSTGGLTNLSFELVTPANRFTNWTISPSNAAIATASVQNSGSATPVFTLSSQSGQSLQNTSLLGTLGFTTLPGDSGFIPVSATAIMPVETNGVLVANPSSQPGQVVVIGLHPLLAPVLNNNSTITLSLYGNTGSNYQMAYTTNLASTNWQLGSVILLTNLQSNININATAPHMYFRLQ